MNEIEEIKSDIVDLRSADFYIQKAMESLNSITDMNAEYVQLNNIANKIDDKIIELEVEQERLEEEAYCQENEEQWKAEQKEQEYGYWSDQF